MLKVKNIKTVTIDIAMFVWMKLKIKIKVLKLRIVGFVKKIYLLVLLTLSELLQMVIPIFVSLANLKNEEKKD